MSDTGGENTRSTVSAGVDYLKSGSSEFTNAAKQFVNAGVQLAGGDALEASEGKPFATACLWAYWISLIIILIAMIVLAVIFYNDYSKYTWDATIEKWTYVNEEGNTVEWQNYNADDLWYWNLCKHIINGALVFVGFVGIVGFIFVDPYSGKEGACGATQLGYWVFLVCIWLIISIVWNVKLESHSYKALEVKEDKKVEETFKTIRKLRRF